MDEGAGDEGRRGGSGKGFEDSTAVIRNVS